MVFSLPWPKAPTLVFHLADGKVASAPRMVPNAVAFRRAWSRKWLTLLGLAIVVGLRSFEVRLRLREREAEKLPAPGRRSMAPTAACRRRASLAEFYGVDWRLLNQGWLSPVSPCWAKAITSFDCQMLFKAASSLLVIFLLLDLGAGNQSQQTPPLYKLLSSVYKCMPDLSCVCVSNPS